MFFNKNLIPGIWLVTLMTLFALAALGIVLEKPMGSLSGQITLEQEKFGLSTYSIRDQKVYAIAYGPRQGVPVERGVWVNADGTFQLNQLPVGEYTLRVRAPGFTTETRNGVFVHEGQVTELYRPFAMGILKPTVNIASNSRVYTPSEAPAFWLNASGAVKATVKIYPANMLNEIKKPSTDNGFWYGSELSVYKPADKFGNPFENSKAQSYKPLQVLKRKLDMDQSDWAHAEFKLAKSLPVGDYFATAEVANIKNETAWNVMWFSVTDLGLVIKQAPEKTVVRAINLTTLKPVSGAKIQLLDKEHQLKNWGVLTTNAEGWAEYVVPASQKKQSSYSLLAYGSANLGGVPQHAYGGISFWSNDSDQYKTYFYTERPIYRLGQTVYFKGITRHNSENGLSNPGANLPVTVVLENPDNTKLSEMDLKTSAHGSFHGLFEIPADGKTGAYQVTLTYPDGSRDYESFEVAQYRKPEYQVDVLPAETAPIIAGSPIKTRIRATYYFGAPVANARVKYTVYAAPDWGSRYRLMPRPAYYGYFDDWDAEDGEGYYDSGYAGDYISEGYAQTDENGEAMVEVQSRPIQSQGDGPYSSHAFDQRYKIQAEVTDLSRMTVTGSTHVSVAAGQFALFVQPRQSVYKVGEQAEVEVTAVTYDGKAVTHEEVTVTLSRWVWDAAQESWKGNEIREQRTVTTDAQGKAILQLPLKKALATDTYDVTATATDQAGHRISDQNSIWIANANDPYIRSANEAAKQPLLVQLNQPVFEPGDTAKVMIAAPTVGNEELTAIVAIEGRKLFSYKTVPLKATAQLVELPILKDYAPNVYVSVTVVGKKKQFYHQSKLLKVSPESHFLRVAVTTDKAKYKPGDTVNYTVQVTHPDGSPASNTEVSLGIVDESIYAIRPEVAEDIRKFFYHKIYNAVMTLSSFPEEYSGGPDKIEPRIRKDFRDMAGWFPQLVTNSQGIAKTTIKLPDNLTTWRATARAMTKHTDVGESLQKIIATQDLLVRLALPRFFTQGDRGLITAVVHNYTDKPQPVDLTLALTQQMQLENPKRTPLTTRITIAPDEALRYQWPTQMTESGTATVAIKAIGKTAGDALEQSLPVHPLGIATQVQETGIIPDVSGSKTLDWKLPVGVSPNQVNYQLSLAASSIGPVLGNFPALIDYPYGCTEQTMSRLMPSIIAMQLHQQLGVPLQASSQKKFAAVQAKALSTLHDYQNGDGGWGWWKNDQSNIFLTAYVLEGLSLLSQTGGVAQGENAELIQAGRHWLSESAAQLFTQMTHPKHVPSNSDVDTQIDLAHAYYVLTNYDEKIPAVTQRVIQKNKTLPPESLAYWAMALERQGNHNLAKAMLTSLMALANSNGAYLDWDHTPALKQKLGLNHTDYTYRYTGVESTTLALRAILTVPGVVSTTQLTSVKDWLLLQRGKEGWGNTKTTAQVLRAFMELELKHPTAKPDFTVAIQWNEVLKSVYTFKPESVYQPEQQFDSLLSALGNLVNLHKTGPGQFYFQQTLSYFLPLQPGQAVPVSARPSGLKLEREFFRLSPSVVDTSGRVRFALSRLDVNQIKAGEIILMKVKIDSPIQLPYAMVQAPLPSGGEVISDDPRSDLMAHDSQTSDAFEWDFMRWWWTHQDILDDRIVFFSTTIPAGKSEVQTLIRMEMPGTFQLNPVQLSGMYSKNIQVYSPLDQLTVREP